MEENRSQTLKLGLTARPEYLPVVTRFVEAGAAAFGMGTNDGLKLGLAAEEIFLYLCQAVCPENALDIECVNGLYYTRLTFHFSATEFSLKGLNIASTSTGEDHADFEDMGLMIASRSIDRLHLAVEKGKQIRLSVTKDKTYPRILETLPFPAEPETLTPEEPDSEGVKRFALLVRQCFRMHNLPSFFDYPGLVADMVAGGEYRLITANNGKNEMVGGILFRQRTERIVEAFGPYILHTGAGTATAEALLDACLSRIGRTRALGLLSRSGLPAILEDRFEPLGCSVFYAPNRPPTENPVFFRHLHEDPGYEVWSQGELTAWLEREYDRLVLARRIRPSRNMGETRSGFSVFSTELERGRGDATLRPLLPGADSAANLERHIRYILREEFHNLFFELDLGLSWHAELIPALEANRFKPQILLPFAGQADLVIFQYHDAT